VSAGIIQRLTRLEEDGLTAPDPHNPRDQIIVLLPRLRRFCTALAGSVDEGDDLAQSTIERALGRLDQWEPGTKLDSWMFRIAQNINIDTARSRIRRGPHVDAEMLEVVVGDDGRHITEARSALARAQQAMSTLPPDQRALMALVVVEGVSYKEAAHILDIPIGTVMSRIARARQTISTLVNGKIIEQDDHHGRH
jgi:RNA polymerase sigma-70 factor, ECF subfamily